MNKDIEQISEQLGKKTVLLPDSTNADCSTPRKSCKKLGIRCL